MSSKPFFKGLSELRALAAIAVIFHHIELFKSRDGIVSLYNSKFSYFINNLGKNGVYLFFVLSGFLITYLLIHEKEQNYKIQIKKFFMRRVLRIWPLYYFVLLISVLVLPFLTHQFPDFFQNAPYYYSKVIDLETHVASSLPLYLAFVPNVALYFYNYGIVGASQSWSVGVEEQFYLIWPFIFLVFNRKYWLYIFALIFCIMFVIAAKVTRAFPFEYMAIGAIGGYVNYYFKEKMNFLNGKGVYLLIISVLMLLLVYPVIKSVYYQSLVFAVFVVLLLLHTVNAPHKLIFLSKPFNFLGTISYGIYMYHPLVMYVVFAFINSLKIKNLYLYNFSIYFLVLGITFLISFLSYKYLEKRFIILKDFKFGAYNK